MGDNWRQFFSNIDDLICCPIIDRIGEKEAIVGTATHVMPGVFMTAKHVVEDWHNRSHGVERGLSIDDYETKAGEFSIRVLQKTKENKFAIWRPEKILIYAGYDVAILIDDGCFNDEAARLIQAKAYPHIGFDLHLPRIGSGVIAKGYPRTQTVKQENGHLHRVSLKTHTGIVEEVYYDGAGLVKTPCFQSTVQADGGMSGGPVFNAENGHIMGIISTSYEPAPDHPTYTTLSPFLWYAFLAGIEVLLVGRGETSLLDLARKEYLHVAGIDHLKRHANGQWSWNEFVDGCRGC